MDDGSETITIPEIRKFVNDCFCSIGVSKVHAELMADVVVEADVGGHTSHGLFRLEKYISDRYNGALDINAEPYIEKESVATAWVNGNNALGCVVSVFCIKLAMAKAKNVGAAIVAANNSNNFGSAGYYTKLAMKEGLIGLAFTNTSPLMLTTRAKFPLSGTNPLSIAAPGLYGDNFVLDMATTVTSGGSIEMKYQNREYLEIGAAVNAACLPETNADVAFKSCRFLPLGSTEELGSYKGTNLSIMVDILCGVLAASYYSLKIESRLKRTIKHKRNIGHCFIVIDPKYFAPNFEMRLTEMTKHLRSMEPKDPNYPVRVPGDKAKTEQQRIDQAGGILYPKYVIDSVKTIAEMLKVKIPNFLPKKRHVEPSASEERLRIERLSSLKPEEDVFVKDLSAVHLDKSLSEISFLDWPEEDSAEWMCPFTSNQNEVGIMSSQKPNAEDEEKSKARLEHRLAEYKENRKKYSEGILGGFERSSFDY